MLMVIFWRDSGRMVYSMDRLDIFGQMETGFKGSGKMMKGMVMEHIFILMEISTLENTRMTCSMDKEHTHGMMAVTIRGIIRITNSMVLEGLLTTKETIMTESGLITGQME